MSARVARVFTLLQQSKKVGSVRIWHPFKLHAVCSTASTENAALQGCQRGVAVCFDSTTS